MSAAGAFSRASVQMVVPILGTGEHSTGRASAGNDQSDHPACPTRRATSRLEQNGAEKHENGVFLDVCEIFAGS
jgi:hypothetical protein